MQPGSFVTPAQFIGGLLDGALLALPLVVVTQALRPCARAVLFLVLLIAAFAYVRLALIGQAGFLWVSLEVLGVVVYGAMAWRGLDHSLAWLVAAWALHPIWDIGLHYFGPGRAFVAPLAWTIPCVTFDLIIAGYLSLPSVRRGSHIVHTAHGVAIRG